MTSNPPTLSGDDDANILLVHRLRFSDMDNCQLSQVWGQSGYLQKIGIMEDTSQELSTPVA